jgi:hypothetical protein
MLSSKCKVLPLHGTQAEKGGRYIALTIFHPAPRSGCFTPGKTPGTYPTDPDSCAGCSVAAVGSPAGTCQKWSLR